MCFIWAGGFANWFEPVVCYAEEYTYTAYMVEPENSIE